MLTVACTGQERKCLRALWASPLRGSILAGQRVVERKGMEFLYFLWMELDPMIPKEKASILIPSNWVTIFLFSYNEN
jgi:hypothetical protein